MIEKSPDSCRPVRATAWVQRVVRRLSAAFDWLRPGGFSSQPASMEGDLEALHDVHWEIADSAARYKDLLNAQSDMIWRRDARGRLTYANRSFLAAFGLDEQALGTDFCPAVEATDRAGLAGSGETVECVATFDGPRWIAWRETQVVPIDGGATELLTTGRDVTQARATAIALQDARDQAEGASRAKSRFLAAMSHEIRTPMTSILGHSRLLLDGDLNDEQRGYTEALDRSARGLLVLIDEILDFSRIEAGKVVLNKAPFSLNALVTEVVGSMAPRAIEKGLMLSQAVDPSLPSVVIGDAARVRQILVNLVSNAVKFTDAGSVAIAAKVDGERIAISVADTGVGLTRQEQGSVFTEFEQGNVAIRRQLGGTGLGLAISNRLAHALGGELRLQSKPGHGATFTLALPLAAEAWNSCDATTAGVANVEQTSPVISGKRVLLAEDNEINRLLTTRVLQRAGIEVVCARNGREAIDAIRGMIDGQSKPVDLVLMDIYMPDVDGLEAMKAIRVMYADLAAGEPKCPAVIALTANAFEDDRRAYFAAGMDDYLAKPFEPESLCNMIAKWTQRPTAGAPAADAAA